MFRYDLHTHSCASHDCKTRYRDLVEMTRRRGLTGIALTDHDTIGGCAALQSIWPEDLHLIHGCERTLEDGSHIIGLFLSDVLRGSTLRDVVAEIRAQGGLIYLPHPYREYSGVLGAAAQHSEDDRAWIAAQADLIEIYNRKCTAAENARALALANELQKNFAGGSDAHRPHEIGFGVTEFAARLSPTEFTTHAALGLSEQAAALQTAHREVTPSTRPRDVVRNLLKDTGLLKPARSLRNRWLSRQQPSLIRYR